MTLAATYLGANGWLLDFNGLRVLVDPWLKGELSFPPGAWLLRGELGEERDAPDNLDLLLLTQGLADHPCPSMELTANGQMIAWSIAMVHSLRITGGQPPTLTGSINKLMRCYK